MSLNVRHCLAVGNPSDTSCHTTRFPEDLDVLASNLPITISGSFDGCRVSATDIVASSLATHIASYFRTNAEELRLSTVSDVYIDSNAKVLLTFSRQYPPVKSEMRPHGLLVALELDFSWKIIDSSCSTNKENQLNITSHPFSQKLSLPLRGLLDNVIRRFMKQCVKRYPLIFGSWCQVCSSISLLTQVRSPAAKYQIYSRCILISNLISKHRISPQSLLQFSASWKDHPTNPFVIVVIGLLSYYAIGT